MSQLYLTLIGNEKGDYVDSVTLWTWIKNIVRESQEKHDRITEKNERNLYKEFCEKLIKEYDLKDIKDLINFINVLLAKDSKNKKRVEKIKNMLLAGKIRLI